MYFLSIAVFIILHCIQHSNCSHTTHTEGIVSQKKNNKIVISFKYDTSSIRYKERNLFKTSQNNN